MVGKDGTSADTILNRTPISADTNRNVIRDRLPNAYLPDLISKNGEAAVRATLETHFISPAAFNILLRDPFTADDFDAFISERQRTIMDAIDNLLVKERLDLSPKLRELDAGMEAIELRLRAVIADLVGNNTSQLPPHIASKASDRVASAIRKNPGLDIDPTSLTRLLEYCDLRELQEIITSKASWPVFESSFGTKESLNGRFGQLAELRNGIRHSRTVDEVTRKDGEAAILWFSQVLGQVSVNS